MNNPLVSIVIPHYNNAELFCKTIDCIENQTFGNWELIIVDDGSNDDSISLIKRKVVHNPKIIFIKRDIEQLKGGQTCRNIGYKKSSGKYVVFFDSDDLISEICLEQRVLFMENNPELDFGIFPAHSFSDEANYEQVDGTNIWGKKTNKDVLSSFLMNTYQFAVWTNIYKRESLKGISWDSKVLVRQDLDFNLSTIFAGLKYEFCEDAQYDYFYRMGYSDSNVCKSFTNNGKDESTIYLFEKIISQLTDEKYNSRYLRQFKEYIIIHFMSLLTNGLEKQSLSYIHFVSHHYNRWFVDRMIFVHHLCFYFSKKLQCYRSMVCLLTIVFLNKYYGRVLINYLKH